MQKPAIQKMFYLFMKLHARPLINFVFGKKAKKEPVIDWGIKHGCYAYEAKDAYGYAQNHCNVGNGKIVLDTICGWIEQIDRDAAE